MKRRLAVPYAAVGLTTAVLAAVGALTLRVVDPVPMVTDTFGFADAALVGFAWFGLAFAVVGAILVVRRPDNAVGWLMVFVGWAYAVSSLGAAVTSSAVADGPAGATRAAWAGLATVVVTVLGGSLFGLAIIFPTGRGHTPRWDRVFRVSVYGLPLITLAFVTQPGPLHLFPDIQNPAGIGPDLRVLVGLQLTQIASAWAALFVPIFGWAIASRYRAADAIGRHQLKWFILSMLVAMTALSIAAVAPLFTDQPPEIGLAVFGFAGALVPIAIGIAILRHGLYDIDRLISRTIGYGIVTGVLAVVFFGSVVGLSALLGEFAEASSLAVALSTLLVAVLFGPIRRRAQAAIDRRFDRAAYDATRTVALLTARLRNETSIERVEADVVGLVDRTFRPDVAGIWLRPSRARRPRSVTISGRPAATVTPT